uniref:Polyprotein n=1 Tax=Rodentolepis nana TaxID=102285 RepID=A0A0R3T4A0_RODNA
LGPLDKLNFHFSRRSNFNLLHQKHHQVTNAAFDTDESESASTHVTSVHQQVSPLPGDAVSPQPQSITTTYPPILQINEIEAHDMDEHSEVMESCYSAEGDTEDIETPVKKKRRRRKRTPDVASVYPRSSEALSAVATSVNSTCGLVRRNSYCPTRLMPPDTEQLLVPERKARSENGSQLTIIRTSSERRFYVSHVTSSNPLDVVKSSKPLSGSVAVL